METYSTHLKMQNEIMDKLVAVKATSEERAVTVEEARLELQEQNWLPYVAGGLFAKVKKTKNNRYYVRV
ncbi:MAG: hypothetical protein OEW48_21160 [Phycisphaerae bacterium]|nr:hypothetical protein [Phycisphaerae bacterium]